MMQSIIFPLLLIYASVSDIRKREVADTVPVMILLISLIDADIRDIPTMLPAMLIVPLPQIIITVMNPGKGMGGADIKLTAACSFLLGMERGLLAVIIGLLLAVTVMPVLYRIKNKDRKQPFALVPYLAFGSMAAYFL